MPDIRSMTGPYEILEPVAKGGMATVYRGRRREDGQIVAIKVMGAEIAAHPVLVKRFEQEFSVAIRLRHPNVVQALDFGLEDGRPFLVMEFIDGQDLAKRIAKKGRLPLDEALRIILQVADALRFAHANKLIHRDVNSSNILLTRDGQAKLADLGLIKDLANGQGLTRTRTCLGTIAFIGPEQYEDAKRADVRSDVYGLGATLYHALTGVVPFPGRRNLQILKNKLLNDFVPARRIVPSLPLAVDQAIRQALDASPERRQGSCQEFIDSLGRARPAPDEAPTERPEAAAGDQRREALPDPKERRRAPRFPSALGAKCRSVHDTNSQWIAEVNDVSATGIRLEVPRRFEPGAMLAVEVLDEDSNAVSTLYAKVLWVRQVALRKWGVGCAFKHELDPSELDALLGNKPKTIVLHQD